MAAHPDRLRILGLCAHADLTVCELAEILSVCRERVARHVRLLARADFLCCNEQPPWRSYHRNAGSNDGGLFNYWSISCPIATAIINRTCSGSKRYETRGRKGPRA
ncbi:ArsR family transcriptional regulator [Mesorhizobium sp. M0676]